MKSWFLGWYSSSHLSLNAEDIQSSHYSIFSIAHYNEISSNDEYTIIKITESADLYDYFISYNRKTGITLNREEGFIVS